MPNDTTPARGPAIARHVARTFTAVLWLTGSAYLVSHGLQQPNPNWVEIVSIPAIWAAVIAAPIVAHHAWGGRDRTAAMLLLVAGLVGSAYTLAGTIARQSEGADESLARAAAIEQQRADLTQRLVEARGNLAKYRADQARECASGKGKRCDGITYTVQTWTAAIEGYEQRLGKLPAPQRPDAGERRIAAFVALLPNVSTPIETLTEDVRLVKPTLFGLFLEAAALAFAFYGFRPCVVPATPPRTGPELPTATVHIRRPMGMTKPAAEAEIIRLRGIVPSQDDLAERWQVHKGTVSKWMTDFEARGLVTRHRDGHCKAVARAVA